jgi:hypothetical protein
VFAKVHGNLRRKLGMKAFRGVMVGYSYKSPGYRIYNPATRRITTFVYIKFEESVPSFGSSHHVDSSIDVCADADVIHVAPASHPLTDLSMDTEDIVHVLEVDKPTRIRGPPAHFEDYVAHVSTVPRVCVTVSCETDLSEHMDDILPLPNFSLMVTHPHHMSSEGPVGDVALVSASVCVEPTSYKVALASPQSAEWKTAMQLEFDSLTSNQTWDLVLAGRRVVNNMWIYRAKTDANGAVSRYKARFVAKGCSQREGINYTETFSPVIRLASLRDFFSIAAARDLELGGLDIDTAFMHAPIKEDVYIRQPLGFDDGTTNVSQLRRCLYGLKQLPREFNELLRDWLVSLGWRQLKSDPCIYILEADNVFAMIALYVDDIHVACNDTA